MKCAKIFVSIWIEAKDAPLANSTLLNFESLIGKHFSRRLSSCGGS